MAWAVGPWFLGGETMRAFRPWLYLVLGAVPLVAAEDTRVSAVLLRHYGIATRPLAVHAHNEAARAEQLIALLQAGKSVALVSDAGTPAAFW